MKKMVLVVVTLAIVFFTACEKTEVTTPSLQNVASAKVEATNSFTTVTEQTTTLARAVAAVPSITGITCDNMGVTTSYSTTLFKDYFIGDTELEKTLTIDGSNFGTQGTGSTQGTVSFSGVMPYKITSISSWGDRRIVVKFKASYNSEPTTNASIVVKTAGTSTSALTATRAIAKLAPAVHTRQYGECTWWAAKRRKEVGLSIPIPSYNFDSVIDANYEPRAFDVWRWDKSHTAFVQNVTPTTSKKDANSNYTVTYDISVTEANADYKGTPNMMYNPTVVITYTYNKNTEKYTKSIKSGTYRSNVKSSATHYYR